MLRINKIIDGLVSITIGFGIFCFCIYSLGMEPLFAGIPEIDAGQDILGTIRGRVWGPDNVPVAEGHVFVTNQEMDVLYGEGITSSGTGPESGSFQISELPVNQDLYVYTMHKNIPGLLSVKKVNLAAGEVKDLAVFIDLKFTNPGFEDFFVARVSHLLNQSHHFKSAEALKKNLRDLSKNGRAVEKESPARPSVKPKGKVLLPVLLGVVLLGAVIGGVLLFGGKKSGGTASRRFEIQAVMGKNFEFDCSIDGSKIGTFTFSNYRLVSNLKKGSHVLKITCTDFDDYNGFYKYAPFIATATAFDENNMPVATVLSFNHNFKKGESHSWDFTVN